MFFGRLNQLQRQSFLAMATKMALADAKVVPEEVKVLADFTATLGDGTSVPPDEIYGPPNTEVFNTKGARTIAILGILIVAYSDRSFHIDESAVLNEAVAAFGVSSEELAQMKTWAQRVAMLHNDFHEMVGVE